MAGFFASPLAKWFTGGLVGLALGAGIGFVSAWNWRGDIAKADAAAIQHAADEKAKAELNAALKEQHDRETAGFQVALQAAEQQQKVVTVTQTITKEIPVHVTEKADRSRLLTLGWLRVIDAYALGVPAADLPIGAGKSDDDPSPIAPSVVAAGVGANYATCEQTRQQLIGLQNWVRAQVALNPK